MNHKELQQSTAETIELTLKEIIEVLSNDRENLIKNISPYKNYTDELYLLLEEYKRST